MRHATVPRPSASAGRMKCHVPALVGIAVFVWSCIPAVAKEFDLRAVDLRVVGESEWTGGGWGGYHPIRYQITNFGPNRDIELRFTPHERGRRVPTVRRRIRLEQNATARVTLAVPQVGGRNSGRLDVLIAGEMVPALRVDVSLSATADGDFPQAAMLILSSTDVSYDGFNAALANVMASLTDSVFPPGHVMSAGMRLGDPRVAVVDPTMLPASWVDYSGLDLVAADLETLARLRTDERAALADWVATGGRLIVNRAGMPGEAEKRLPGMFSTSAESSSAWTPARTADRTTIARQSFETQTGIPNEGTPMPGTRIPSLNELRQFEDAMPIVTGGIFERLEGALDGLDAEMPTPLVNPSWPAEPAPFVTRRIGFGQVAIVADDVFLANGADWTWLLRSLGGSAIIWPVRHGMIAGDGDMEFLNQPIPGVRGVPTAAFLTLITLFTLAIGPVNYLLLWRRSQLSRLVVTVPAIAIGTSALLFGYAVVSHGFGTKGRIRSVTLIDPDTRSATSISRMTLFAGMAPADGLRFSNSTAVYPMYPFRERFVDGTVDWTDTQALVGGWFRTRTRTQFLTVSRRDERGRLTVEHADGGLRATNGFTMPLSKLIVTGEDGRAWFAESVPAGAEAELRPLRDRDWTGTRELAIDRIPEPPDGVEPDDLTSSFLGEMHWRWYQRGWRPQFSRNLLERHMSRLLAQTPGADGDEELSNENADTTQTDDPHLPSNPQERPSSRAEFVEHDVVKDTIDVLEQPRGFLAITETNTNIDTGGLEVDERGSLHVLMGTW